MLKGIRDLVYIIPLEDRTTTESGLIISAGQQRTDQGIIKYKGPQVKELKVGQHVVFSGYDGDWMTREDEGTLIVMPESSILSVVASDEPSYVFTRGQVLKMVEEAKKRTQVRYSIDAPIPAYMEEQFLSIINDHFYAELHF